MKIIVKIVLSLLLHYVAITVLKQLGHYEFISYITGLMVCGVLTILNLIIDN